MTGLLQTVVSWTLDRGWTIPLMGLVVAGLAYALGRRFLVARPRRPEVPVDSSFLQGILTDRRAAPRRKGNTVLVELADGTDSPPVAGWVQDRSIGGLCILAERAMTEGASIQVRPHECPETTPWTTILVKSCRPDGGLYELGCQFEHTPPWAVLLMFG
jgi:hypothetical protein